jgi:hypothetical protein
MPDRNPLDPDYLDALPDSRRNFIKKMAAVAFVAPIVGSFTMDSVAFAGSGGHYSPNQTTGNQTHGGKPRHPNQGYGNQGGKPPKHHFPNQGHGNQGGKPPKHHFPNQGHGNQGGKPPKHHLPNQIFGNQTFPPRHKKKVRYVKHKFWKFFRKWNW